MTPPLDIGTEGLERLLYIDVLLESNTTVENTIDKTYELEDVQIYFTDFAAAGNRARIVGRNLRVYADTTKARRIFNFTYEPLWGIFYLKEDTPLASIYVEYTRYSERYSVPVADWAIEFYESDAQQDIYAQPVFFDQPLFPKSLSFKLIYGSVEFGKLFIRDAVLNREFFLIIDNNPEVAFQGYTLGQIATYLRTGWAYEGTIHSEVILHYFRSGVPYVPIKMKVHNFGKYYPMSADWGGLGQSAIRWRDNRNI